MCGSPSEADRLKKVSTGTRKIKVQKGKKGLRGIRFAVPQNGTYTFTFSDFKCDTKKNAGTVFLFTWQRRRIRNFTLWEWEIRIMPCRISRILNVQVLLKKRSETKAKEKSNALYRL